MRQAIKDPIVNRGRTLYIYPQLYEGQECTKHLYCTGPTPAQQCDKLIPYLIKTVGKKRFAMPSANYVWPQLLNKYARKIIEANGGKGVFEEYYPLDQAEYSATIGKNRDGKVDCVFNTVIPPGLQPFVKQLYDSGFQKNGGALTCVYYDENLLNYHPAQEMEDSTVASTTTCRSTIRSASSFRPTTPKSSPIQASVHRRLRSTGMYRGIKFYEAAVKATNGDLARKAVSVAMDKAKIEQGPGGGAEMGRARCTAR